MHSPVNMKIELINIGTELMAGHVLNTHHMWMAKTLFESGYRITRQICIDDEAKEVRKEVESAVSTADIVLTTGGLGPTSDDLTRETIAELLGKTLHRDETVMNRLRSFFESKGREIPTGVDVQADVPDGAEVIINYFGTAPGLILRFDRIDSATTGENRKGLLVMLPGPPRELRPMFKDQILPYMKQHSPLEKPLVCVILRTTGIGESIVESRLKEPLKECINDGLEIGFCAQPGMVDIRLQSQSGDAEQVVAMARKIVEDILSKYIYGVESDLLEERIIQDLTKTGKRVVTVESCTGGRISDRLTNIPGASAVVWGGFTTYSNESKSKCIGVNPQTLEQFGAVSSQTAAEMAEGALKQSGAEFALSVTGIAGPSGGSSEKPIGTVFIGIASKSLSTRVLHKINVFDRETFKTITSNQALDLLRKTIRKSNHEPSSG